MTENELKHYGVLGMKWGVRRNRSGSTKNPFKKHKQKKQRQSNLKKAREAKAAKKEHEMSKQEALSKGKASDILKFKGELTNEEMQRAVNRINLERQLSQMSAAEVKAGQNKVEQLINTADKIRVNAEKAKNIYNFSAGIYNSLSDDKLPILDGTSMKDKEKKKAREKLIKSGTPEQVEKKFGDFTVKELEELNKRYLYEDNIRKRIKND